jgi:uncharacterized protein (DUF433 family)
MVSTLMLEPLTVPLREEPSGVFRVGNSHVLLELVIRSFQRGLSPAEIVQSFDSLELADVYAVVAYYLSHQTEVDAYLKRREQESEELRQRVELIQKPRPAFKETLERRRANAEEGGCASAAQ